MATFGRPVRGCIDADFQNKDRLTRELGEIYKMLHFVFFEKNSRNFRKCNFFLAGPVEKNEENRRRNGHLREARSRLYRSRFPKQRPFDARTRRDLQDAALCFFRKKFAKFSKMQFFSRGSFFKRHLLNDHFFKALFQGHCSRSLFKVTL